jgi:hypothetical protein
MHPAIDRLRANPLRSRDDLRRFVLDLQAPLKPFRVADGIDLPGRPGYYGEQVGRIESFLRPWWGLVPVTAGDGGAGIAWADQRAVLRAGTDPALPTYWGKHNGQSNDQRVVEMAPLAMGLLFARSAVWDPLDADTQDRLVAWLGEVRHSTAPSNNWLFFNVLVLIALRALGRPIDEAFLASCLDRIELLALDAGWYSDGPNTQRDYYVPMALHYFGLIYADRCGDRDPARAARFRDRAARFASEHQHWFCPDGTAVPFGRSQTYRFAQGAFWSAVLWSRLPVPGLTTGQIKGLWLRNLRWWAQQPIWTEAGVLSVGYRYPAIGASEPYNAPGSPMWAAKTFLALALPPDDPLWTVPEEPLPARPAVVVQAPAGVLIQHDDPGSHTVVQTAGQWAAWLPGAGHKYSKCAYSSFFGFSSAGSEASWADGWDSCLSLSADGSTVRSREACAAVRVGPAACLASRWHPWADVLVETWQGVAGMAQVRIHRITTPRPLQIMEAGFAVAGPAAPWPADDAGDTAWCSVAGSVSAIRCLAGGLRPGRLDQRPGIHLMFPQAALPVLRGRVEAGEHLLACAQLGLPQGELRDAAAVLDALTIAQHASGLVVSAQGRAILCSDPWSGQTHLPTVRTTT